MAVGKSTVGRLLAQRLGFRFFDTGAMYRALTWKALKLVIPLDDEERLSQLARETRMSLIPQGIRMDGVELTVELRSPAVEEGVSQVSSHPGVRQILVAEQHRLAGGGGVVMVGRDIGTVVLPQAEIKVFLTASAEERAQRRFRELGVNYQAKFEDLKRRDSIDSQRQASPLRPAADAHIINTEGLTPEMVVEKVMALRGRE